MNEIKFCCKNYPSKKRKSGIIAFYNERKGVDLFWYSPRTRRYINSHSKDIGSDITYCQFCGTKMAKELCDEWLDVLEKEYGLTDVSPGDYHDPRIPPEFWTDEWWKKRGL
jgi:hypothetical protein